MSEDKNIIFLDVDGVLNNFHSLADGIFIIPEKCKMIERLCKEHNAKIVISSTWRYGETLKSLQKFFGRVGINEEYIIGLTPEYGTTRGDEIYPWLIDNPDKWTKYIIIDDDDDFYDIQKTRHIQTDMRTGFCWKHYDKAVKLMNKEMRPSLDIQTKI